MTQPEIAALIAGGRIVARDLHRRPGVRATAAGRIGRGLVAADTFIAIGIGSLLRDQPDIACEEQSEGRDESE